MSDQDPDDTPFSAALVTGVGLVVASVVAAVTTAAGVSVSVGGFNVVSLAAGVLAVALIVWGLHSATQGAYRRGVGSLSGGAGFVLVFLAPQARSEPLFVGTAALILALSGLFLIAEGFGYVLVAVDDTAAESTVDETASDSESESET